MRRIQLITTGGTIEKTYDEHTGELSNRNSVVRRMLRRLRLEGAEVHIRELLSKDSLLMTSADRELIVEAVRDAAARAHCVLILHGTDTLEQTGERLYAANPAPNLPVVLTGAMRPFEMKRSDALQNLTESLLAASLLSPGVYAVAHGRALAFPGVVKDRVSGTFVKQ